MCFIYLSTSAGNGQLAFTCPISITQMPCSSELAIFLGICVSLSRKRGYFDLGRIHTHRVMKVGWGVGMLYVSDE